MITTAFVLSTVLSKLKVIGYFIWDNWRISLPFIAIILLLLWVLFSFACGDSEPRTNKTQQDIINKRIETGIAQGNVNKALNEANNANQNTNIANNNFLNSVNRDSNEWAGHDAREATDRFCRRFPNDSTCAEWRRHNPTTPVKSP